MKHKSFLPLVTSLGSILLLSASRDAIGGAAISAYPPALVVKYGSTYSIDIKFYTWSNSVGAFQLRLQYDPTKTTLIAITVPTNSLYQSNVFWNTRTFYSGDVRVTGFQTSDYSQHPEGVTAFTATFTAGSFAGVEDQLQIQLEKVIDGTWKAIEVSAYGADVITDTAGDGIPDAWKLQYGFDIYDPTVANQDPAGDGFTNLQKYNAGANPLVFDPAVSIKTISRMGNTVLVIFPTRLGKNYQLERTDDLNGGTWSPTASWIVGSGNLEQFVDTLSPGGPDYFYRIALVPF
jgi:hypothetical protein